MMLRTTAAFFLAWSSCLFSAHAQEPMAPVEARVPFAPTAFTGSDGSVHLAYELHITNFYGDTGPLRPLGLKVFSDDASAPLVDASAEMLPQMTRPAPADGSPVSIPPGKRIVILVWATLPADAEIPRELRHRMEFSTDKNAVVALDGATVAVGAGKAIAIGAPLRGGRWLAHEGPGGMQSHHWGSLVAVNGALTIPQRYALDLVGIDAQGHVMKPGVKDIQKSRYADWIGYGAEVLAVADGVVRGTRDGEAEHRPLSPQGEPASLTANGLFGNYVVLEIKPGVFASYAHLQRGSVKVKPGDRVRKGEILGRLGQSGNSAAPHLHFHLSNGVAFEGSEGIPYV
ncbi:MAG: M23 family metallopeptidase, partial [Bradyrhizobium sp.]